MARPGGSRVLRLIGGTWRGRKIQFPPVEGIRPTPDRIRETLFNWLAPVIHDARCLDLFAGSGAIGFEALSRGAAKVVMVERERKVVDYLRGIGTELAPSRLEVVQADALQYLDSGCPPGTEPYDIVFLDPPFRQDLLGRALAGLVEGGWLAPGAIVYVEAEKELGEPVLPRGWRLRRRKEAGQVAYHLIDTPGA